MYWEIEATYEASRIVVCGPKSFDTFDIISKEMKFDRFEAERLWLLGHRFR